MPLDPEDPAFRALLAQALERIEKKLDTFEAVALRVNTHDSELTSLKKDNSGHHRAIQEVKDFASQSKGGTKVLYAVILLFSGFTTGATLTAIGLFFHQSNIVADLSATVRANRNDLDILLGAKK